MRKARTVDRTRWLIAAVSVGGAVLLGGAASLLPPLSGDLLRLAAVLVVLTAAAEFVGINVKHGDQGELLTLFELAVVADIVLLPPTMAVVVSALGLALVMVIQRKPLVKFAFNIGQYTLGVVPAVALYDVVGGHDFETVAGLASLAGGMAVFTLSNLITISAIIAATTGRPLRKVISEEGPVSFAMGLGNSAVGVVAVALYLTRPVLLAAVLAPTLAMHQSFRGWVKQKELSQRMEEETTKLGRILEHSSEGIVLAGDDGRVLVWNPSMERVTGVPATEAIGKALSFLLRGRDAFGQPVTIDVDRTPGTREIEVVAADGTARWLRIQHGPGYDETGALTFDVLVVTDVTRQREVDRLKDDFFSTVSHELRTPLTPIKGYATLLLRRIDDMEPGRRKEALQSILERSDHMARLVEDLLLASKIANSNERRLPEVERKTFDITATVERVMRSFRTGHPLREFELDAPEACPAVGDPLRVEQVVANLLSNAVKFSEEGAPVRIAVERDANDVKIHVTDEGRGIPSDKHDEIFEKFRRLEDPLRMETGGAGLGLFIVRQLVRAMGGTVSVTSVQGRGSTFTVALQAAAHVTMGTSTANELAG